MKNTLKQIVEWIINNKTHSLVIVGCVSWFMSYIGILTPEQLKDFLTLIGIGSVATLRLAIQKVIKSNGFTLEQDLIMPTSANTELVETNQKQVEELIVDNIKNTGKLYPKFQYSVDKVIEEMIEKGHNPKIAFSIRSFEEQDKIYAQGRTEPGNIVTNARGGLSYHNYGIAVDIIDREKGWNTTEQFWIDLNTIATKHGLETGYNWKFTDKAHVQMVGIDIHTLYKLYFK